MGRTACNLHSKLGGDDTATARWTASWRRPGLRLATRSSHPATLIQASTGSAVLLTAKAKVLRALSRVHDILGSKLRLDSTWPRARSSAAGSAPQQRALRAQTIPSSVPVHVVARMGGADSACRNFSTAASPPPLETAVEAGAEKVHRQRIRDLLDTCQLHHPPRAGYEAVALERYPRAWQKPMRPASALRRTTAVARASRRRLCCCWLKARPGKLMFLPGCY